MKKYFTIEEQPSRAATLARKMRKYARVFRAFHAKRSSARSGQGSGRVRMGTGHGSGIAIGIGTETVTGWGLE